MWVDVEQFPGIAGYPLANVAVSTIVTSTNAVPLVVERSMWWPGGGDMWHDTRRTSWSYRDGHCVGAG